MMEHPNFIVLLFAAGGVLFVLLGIPLKQGEVPPNWFYGFRHPKDALGQRDMVHGQPCNRRRHDPRRVLSWPRASLIVFALRNWIESRDIRCRIVAVMLVIVVYMAIHGLSLFEKCKYAGDHPYLGKPDQNARV